MIVAPVDPAAIDTGFACVACGAPQPAQPGAVRVECATCRQVHVRERNEERDPARP